MPDLAHDCSCHEAEAEGRSTTDHRMHSCHDFALDKEKELEVHWRERCRHQESGDKFYRALHQVPVPSRSERGLAGGMPPVDGDPELLRMPEVVRNAG